MAVAPGWWFDGEGGEGGWVAVSCGHVSVFVFSAEPSTMRPLEEL